LPLFRKVAVAAPSMVSMDTGMAQERMYGATAAALLIARTDETAWYTLSVTMLMTVADYPFTVASRRLRTLGYLMVTAGIGYYRVRGEKKVAGTWVTPDPLYSYSFTNTTWQNAADVIDWQTLPDDAYQTHEQYYNDPGGAGNVTRHENPAIAIEVAYG